MRASKFAAVLLLWGSGTAWAVLLPVAAWPQDMQRELVRVAIAAENREYEAAYSAADAEALARVYDAEGARLSENGRIARGREAIASSVGGFLERVGPVEVRLETVDVWVMGDLAWETGIWSYPYTPPAGTERTVGRRYVTPWRRQPEGGWRILADLSDGHGGGVVAVLKLLPERDCGVVVLVNARRPEPSDEFGRMYADIVALEALDVLYPGFRARFESALRSRRNEDRSEALRETLATLAGQWTGYARTFEGDSVPISLDVRSPDDVHIQVDGQFAALLDGLRLLRGGVIGARFPSSFPNDEGYDIDHVIRLNLLPLGAALVGYMASNVGTPQGAFDLPNYVRLEPTGR